MRGLLAMLLRRQSRLPVVLDRCRLCRADRLPGDPHELCRCCLKRWHP